MNSIKRNNFQGTVKARFLAIILSILFFQLNPSFAQVFPVQANIHVAPPYSVYLSHYTSPGQEKVMVSAVLTNPSIPSIDVKFRFTIEGAGIRLTTSPAWNPPPFTLSGGVPVSLPQELIAEYLRPQHLLTEGVNPSEFFRSGKLPEGFYQFRVEVIEYRRNIVISNAGRAMLWLVLNEPPRIVFPLAGQKVMATNPQMLSFTWIPSGASSPLSSLTTQYEFTLVELVDKAIDPTVAITTASSASRYVKVTEQTSLFYGPGEMPLTPGKTYAIRVKAFTSDGLEMFKNGGYSEVRTFKFGDACNTPISFTLKNPKQSGFDISVVTDPSNTAWQAHFRENADPEGEWSELKPEPGVNPKTQRGLKASTEYEVQVKGLCGEIASDYTPSQTITTGPMADPNRSCDGNATPFAADNAPPLEQLRVNDFFLAALFPIKVTEVKSQSGGRFTGSGVATLPLFNVGLAVTFENIGINNLMQLTSGEVKVVRNEFTMALIGDDPIKPPVGDVDDPVDDPTSPNDDPIITDTIFIPSDYDSIVVKDDNTLLIYPPNGATPVSVDLGGSSTTLLVPADGNMDNAKIVYDGAAHPYTPNQGGTNGTSGQGGFSGFLANFRPHEGQVYGFDSMQYAPYTSFYNEMRINGKLVKLPWKALELGKPDRVYLNIQRSNPSYPYTNLKVGVMGGADLMPSMGGDTPKRTYSLMGAAEGEEAIVATYQDSSKTKYAGGIWTVTYQSKPFKLYLVPLPGIDISDADRQSLQQDLNTKIFSQAVVTWTVVTLPGITGVDLGDNGLDWADKGMLSSYNAEMNGVISTFKDWKKDVESDAYYLFVVPKFSEGGVEGFMPRNRRFGFITQEQVAMRTVAHELGHGAFNLKHTFPEVPQGTTKNLMDYSDGLALYKPQWDLIHNPEFTTGLWDGMEDGASLTDDFGLLISAKAKELSQQLKTDVYAIIHVSKCTETSSKPLTNKSINSFSATDIELRRPILLNLHVDKDYKLWTVLYFTVKDENNLSISTPTSSNDDFTSQVNKIPFLGYSIPPYTKVIECSTNQEGLDAFACNSSEEYFASFDKADRVNIYITLLLSSISKCMVEQNNDKVGDQFYREFSSKTTSEQETQQLRQIADVFNKIGDALLKKNNTEGWEENGDYFRSSYEAYKQLGYSFDEYLSKINSYLNLYEQKKTDLEKFTDSERTALAVNAFSDKEIEYLPVTLRSKCLTSLASAQMSGSFNLFGHNEEYTALRLIKYIQNKDVKEFLAKLEAVSGDKALIVALRNRIDDGIFGIGGDNFQKLIAETRNLVNKSSDLQERLNSLVNTDNFDKRLMQWQVSQEVIGAIKVSNVTLANDGTLTVKRSEIKGFTSQVVAQDGLAVREADWQELSESTPLKPFDLIIFVNNSNLDVLNEATGTGNGEFTIVPALFLNYADQKQFNNDVVQAVSVATDVATIAVSGGTLTVAKNLTRLRRAWLLFETINSGVNLTINITGIANDPNCKEVVDAYNKVTCLLAIGELSYSGAKNLPSIINKAQKAAEATVDALKNAAQNFVDVLNKVDPSNLTASAKVGYKQLLEFAEKLKVKYGLTVVKIAEKSVDELKALWNSLSDLPAKTPQKTYTLYRRVNKDWEPAVTHPAQILNDGNRYSKAREAVYFGTSREVTDAEWLAYNEEFGLRGKYGSKLYKFEVEESDLLDLTKPETLEKLGINQTLITEIDNKTIPQELGDWAFSKGYKGVIFPSARKTGESNIVIFKYFTGNTPPGIKSTTPLETLE